MLIPKLSLSLDEAPDFGAPGSELRSMFLFGDAYLELSEEDSTCSPPDCMKDGLLATHGKWLRAGPFPGTTEGLAAAAEWLHAGTSSAAIDVGAASLSGDAAAFGGLALPSLAEAEELVARFKDLWKAEQPRSRLVARIALQATTPSAVVTQAAREHLGALFTALRPHVGAVQLAFPASLLHSIAALTRSSAAPCALGGGEVGSGGGVGVLSYKGARGGDHAPLHLRLAFEPLDSPEPNASTVPQLSASELAGLHRCGCHFVAPACLRTTSTAADDADDERLKNAAPSPSAAAAASSVGGRRSSGGGGAVVATALAAAAAASAAATKFAGHGPKRAATAAGVAAGVAAAVVGAVLSAAASQPATSSAPLSSPPPPAVDTASLTLFVEQEPAAKGTEGCLRYEVVDCFLACLVTDRPDGLFATAVCDLTGGAALGLVYSSRSSVRAAALCGRGVYWSRSRKGLWRKGDTSGAWQVLHRIEADCDADALRFTVTQKGNPLPAFCHRNCYSCWGGPRGGIGELEQTLGERLSSAPVGSYTKRLFEDKLLLQNKLLEEAQELIEAEEPDHAAAEAADVLYFALARCAVVGATLPMIESHLDRRALKLKRRPGNAKEYRIKAAAELLNKQSS